MKSRSVAGILLIMLMACTPSPQATPAISAKVVAAVPPVIKTQSDVVVPPGGASTADTCNIAFYSGAIGKPVTDPAVPPGGLDWTIGAVRIIEPDDKVTMDFDEERLNIDVDAAGIVTGMRCG